MKTCGKCKHVGPEEDFPKGKSTWCKACHRAYHQDRREELNALRRNRREAHIEEERASCRKWSDENREKKRVLTQKNFEENRERYLANFRRNYREKKHEYYARVRARKVTLMLAQPKWVDQSQIAQIYKLCIDITEQSGIVHHVDHIVPLRGEGVSGLHVPWNLRVIPASENLSKGNRILGDFE